MKYFPSLIIISFFLCSIDALASKDTSRLGEKNLVLFNRSLEIIETKLKASDYDSACLEAIKSATLIDQNVKSLNLLEPNYDWNEIRAVLIQFPRKHCPNLIKSYK